MPSPLSFAVLGAGSWGTALAVLLGRNQHQVSLWTHEPEVAATLQSDRENRVLLPGIPFPSSLKIETDLAAAILSTEQLLIVVPSHAFQSVIRRVAGIKPSVESLCWATKGLDPDSHQLLDKVARRYLPEARLAVISGPTFAMEVAQAMPTAVTIASDDEDYGLQLAEALGCDTFRAYTSDDMPGVQVGGAVKNVMAIAAGISDGLGFGANTRAALITRGLAEITRLGLALKGKAETFMGLAGLGDLALTCTDNQSRNRRLGLALASGQSLDEARQQIGQEVEGINTAREVFLLSRQLGVSMPITEQTYAVLFEGLDPRIAVQQLLGRRQTSEGG